VLTLTPMAREPTNAPPAGKSNRGPSRSATGPKNGESTPPEIAPIVTAAAVSARLQPRSSLMGFNTTAIVMLLTPAEKKPAIIEIATTIQP
jgi:hypothetical protein